MVKMTLLDEIRELDKAKRWNPTFQMINLETRKIIDDKTVKTARQQQNIPLNRYRDVLPYDESRVELQTGENNYINANYVEVPEVNKKYILTQGPLAHTCKDFWLMVWENKTKGIIMLNRVVEKNMLKCHPYWPMGENEISEFGHFEITNKSSIQENSYTVRTLCLTNTMTSESRTVYQYHFTQWPDFGVPTHPVSFLNFLESIRNADILDPEAPAVVHCSAGIGRSGTFCLVDVALAKAELDSCPDLVNPQLLLLKLREHRCGLIQTAEQYRFANLAIVAGFHSLFPQIFKDENFQFQAEDDTPPPLPPRRTRDNVPPPKPQRNSHYDATDFESSSEEDSEEDDIIDLSDLSDDSSNEILQEDSHKHDSLVKEDSLVDKNQGDSHKTDEESSKTDVTNVIKQFPTDKRLHEENQEIINKSKNIKDGDLKSDIGSKASEKETSTELRKRKHTETKELVDKIKKNMKASEKKLKYQKPLIYLGIVVTLCTGLFIAYRYMS